MFIETQMPVDNEKSDYVICAVLAKLTQPTFMALFLILMSLRRHSFFFNTTTLFEQRFRYDGEFRLEKN